MHFHINTCAINTILFEHYRFHFPHSSISSLCPALCDYSSYTGIQFDSFHRINCCIYHLIASSFPCRLSHCFSAWSVLLLFLGDTATSSKYLSKLHASWSMPTAATEAGKRQFRIVTDLLLLSPCSFPHLWHQRIFPKFWFVWMFCGVRDQSQGFVHGREVLYQQATRKVPLSFQS